MRKLALLAVFVGVMAGIWWVLRPSAAPPAVPVAPWVPAAEPEAQQGGVSVPETVSPEPGITSAIRTVQEEIGESPTDTPEVAERSLRVIDARGDPVEAAMIALLPGDAAVPAEELLDPSGLIEASALFAGPTNAEGLLPLPEELDSFPLLLVVRHPEHAPRTRWLFSAPSSVEIRLGERLVMRGRVVDGGSGRPVAGAKLVAFPKRRLNDPMEDEREKLARVAVGDATESRADGGFDLGPLGPELHRVYCFAAGYPPRGLIAPYPWGDEIVIRLAGEREVSGIVVDEEDSPIEGARVTASSRGELPNPMEETTTDEEGLFSFAAVPAGPISIVVDIEGFAAEKRMFEEGDDVDFLEFQLVPEEELRGVVVDDTGEELAGVVVSVGDLTVARTIGEMESEPDGFWWMHWVHPDHEYRIDWMKDGYRPEHLDGLRPPFDELVLTLRRNAGIRGRVVDGAGRPVTRFALRTMLEDLDPEGDHVARRQDRWLKVEAADGAFSWPGQWAGSYELRVEADGFAPWVRRGVSLAPGEDLEVAIELDPAVTVTGRVQDTAGLPVAGAELYVPDRDRDGQLVGLLPRRTWRSAADGAFSLEVPAGTFDLAVRTALHGTTVLEDLDPRGFPRDIVLESPGAIAGDVVTPWRSPESVCTVRLTPAGAGTYAREARVDGDGRFAFEGISPGAYFVELYDWWSSMEAGTNILPGQWTRVESGHTTKVFLSSRGPGELRGRIELPSGGPRATDFRVLVVRASEGDDMPLRVAPRGDGVFWIRALEAGEYVVRLICLRGGLVETREQRVRVDPDAGPAEVTFALEGARAAGRVLDAALDPVDAVVTLLDEAGAVVLGRVRTDAEGRYAFLALRTGRYQVATEASGFASSSFAVALPFDYDELGHFVEPEGRLVLDVVDDRGTALHGVRIACRVAGLPPALQPPVLFSRGGLAELARLPTTRVVVSAELPGHVPVRDHAVAITAGNLRRETVQLSRLGTLRALVRTKEGLAWAGLEVALDGVDPAIELEGDGTLAQPTDRRGEALFENLVPGTYRVRAGGAAEVTCTVAPGEEVEVQLEVGAR